MYSTNVIDFDNKTDDYNNTLSSNCTNTEINIDLKTPTL